MAASGQGPPKSPIVCLGSDSRHWGPNTFERAAGVDSIDSFRLAVYSAENLPRRRPIYAARHCAMLGNGSKATKMISRAHRSAISRAVAKAIAYHNAGKQEQANRWVAELVRLLGAKGILSREAIDLQPDC
jgi:hypothetical protein